MIGMASRGIFGLIAGRVADYSRFIHSGAEIIGRRKTVLCALDEQSTQLSKVSELKPSFLT